jgi:peptidoglycan biosynthesis protein MviN/MurJ (putative lipid II flippase)
LTICGLAPDNARMTDHVLRNWAPRLLRTLVALVLGAAAAAGGVLLAVVSFEWTAWAPAVVSLALIVGGATLYRKTDDVIGKGLALGLIAGGLLTVLLWPLFAVDTGGGLEDSP